MYFANQFKTLRLDTKIICVDTFIGSVTHWIKSEFTKDLNLKNGYPTLYKEFLSNVFKNGHQDIITPLPVTSLDGARILQHYNISPDLIYIDASHEYPDVLLDLASYYDILAQGGIIFGDDYVGWEGVRKSVDQFAREFNLDLKILGGKWIIKK